jgi:hypothetical protein
MHNKTYFSQKQCKVIEALEQDNLLIQREIDNRDLISQENILHSYHRS